MREFFLRGRLMLLLLVMWVFHWMLWAPVRAVGTYFSRQLDALELAVLIASVERRTRGEGKTK